MADNLDDIKQIISIEVKESGVDEATKDISQLNASIKGNAQAQSESSAQTKKSEESYKNFKTQLREANEELRKAIQIHGETSKEAVKAAKSVAELKDQMGFAKDLADQFNPDQKMKGLAAASNLAATGISGVTSGLALFGDQSKDTEKTLLKVQAAMAFSQSISQLSDLGDQWKILKSTIANASVAQKLFAASTAVSVAVTKLFSKSVDQSSGSFKVLRGAIIGTGIGALVVGIGLLINNFDKVKKVVLNFVPGLEKVGEQVMNIVNAVTDFIGVTSESERAIDRMKANADASIALNKKFLAEHGDQIDEFTKQKIAAKDAYNEAIKEEGADQIALAKRLNRELAAIEYSRGDEKRKIQEENEKKAKEQREKEAEERRKEEKDRLQKDREEFAAFQKKLSDADIEQGILKREQQEQEIKDFEAGLAVLLETSQKFDDEDNARKKKNADIDAAMLQQKKDIQNAQIDIASKGIGLIKDIFGKSKAVQKGVIIADSAVGIGKMVAANNAANIGALATPQAIATSGAAAAPVIALNNISTALGIASTIAATSKALAAVGGGGGGSVSGTSSVPARNAPNVNFQASSENQIASSIKKTEQEQKPIQAYVVSHDITYQQELDNKKLLQNKI